MQVFESTTMSGELASMLASMPRTRRSIGTTSTSVSAPSTSLRALTAPRTRTTTGTEDTGTIRTAGIRKSAMGADLADTGTTADMEFASETLASAPVTAGWGATGDMDTGSIRWAGDMAAGGWETCSTAVAICPISIPIGEGAWEALITPTTTPSPFTFQQVRQLPPT